MAAKPKTYAPEFKLRAVRMIAGRHLGVAEVARRLGVPESRLRAWEKAARADGADAFPGSGRRTPTGDENRRRRAAVKRPEAERDIPRKATPFSAALAK